MEDGGADSAAPIPVLRHGASVETIPPSSIPRHSPVIIAI